MSFCSPEQIEKKKQLALEKLKARQNKPTFTNSNKVLVNSTQLKTTTTTLRNEQLPKAYSSPTTSHHNSTKIAEKIGIKGQHASEKFKSRQISTSAIATTSTGEQKHTYHPYLKPNSNIKPTNFYSNESTVTGTLQLISSECFAVSLSKYYQPANDFFKTVPSRIFDAEKKSWNFNMKDYELVFRNLQLMRPGLMVLPLPPWVTKSGSNELKLDSVDLSSIDSELSESLMPFQLQAVRFGIDKNGRCLLADDMGLGKTFQALAIAAYYRKDWPLLVVTTSSMTNTWQETIQKYLPSVPLHYVQQMQSGKDYISESRILIVSHDLMTRCVEKLQQCKFGVIIIDESHVIKNFKAKCTKAAQTLANEAKRVLLLSGTPALSRPSELYTQLSLINRYFFKDFKEYSRRYCNGHESKFGWDANGQSNLQELEIILNKHFMIRRTKDSVLPELPNKSRNIIKLDENLLKLTVEEQKTLNILENDYNNKKKAHEKNALLLQFFSETAKLKVKAVCAYVTELLKENRKCLIFVHHQVMMDSICKLLDKREVMHIRIDGKTSSDQRNFFVERFNTNEKCRFAILSITAANAGITLTAANLVLFAELHWNPSILSQAECRAHRIGQSSDVEVRYLLASGTADDTIWKIIQNKTNVLNAVGLSKDSFHNASESVQIAENPVNIVEPTSSTIETYFKKVKSEADEKENVNENLQGLTQIFNDDNDVFEEFIANSEEDEALANLVI